jgi:hypothetical protein
MKLAGMIRLIPLICIISLGCAPHRPVQNDLAHGHIVNATWPCTVNAKVATVDCDCSHFAMSVDAKTGNTVLLCAPMSSAITPENPITDADVPF